jgi:hypothetical protein
VQYCNEKGISYDIFNNNAFAYLYADSGAGGLQLYGCSKYRTDTQLFHA